jgi:ferredoxin
MPVVTIEGEGTTTAAEGRRLVLAIEESGVDILHRCGGNARCTTCRVQVLTGDPGPMTEAETNRLARVTDPPENMRLSCQIQVRDDPRCACSAACGTTPTCRILARLRSNGQPTTHSRRRTDRGF